MFTFPKGVGCSCFSLYTGVWQYPLRAEKL